MKTDLTHLPHRKRSELARAVELIRAAEDVDMILLFGSHARGDWVEDTRREGGAVFEYLSDFDLYVLTRLAKTAKRLEHNDRLRRRFAEIIPTPVSLIADTVRHFNENLERGRYFYVDIVKEGIVLFDSARYALSEPKVLTPEQRREEAQLNFDYWFNKSTGFFETWEFHHSKNEHELAAFDLHQAAEHATTAVLLVLSNYKPKGHDLAERLRMCAMYDARFARVFPVDAVEDKRLFDLLCDAYIGARYLKHFRITPDEVAAIATYVHALRDLTHHTCRSRIAHLGSHP